MNGGALFFEIDECDDGIVNDWELSEIDSNIRVAPENHRLTLTREKIAKGLQIFAEKYPSHWADFVNENEDVLTASAFVQCCLFGEIVFN